MKTNHTFHGLAIFSAVAGLAVPTAVNAQDQPEQPRIELKIDGKTVDMKDLRQMVEGAINEIPLSDDTRRKLQQHLTEVAPADHARPEEDAPNPEPRAGSGKWRDVPDSWKIGVVCEPLDDLLRSQLPIPKGTGLAVREVVPNGRAAKAGLAPNDVLLAIGDQPLKAYPQLVEAVRNSGRTGQPLALKVLREGKERIIVIKHDVPPQAPPETESKPGTVMPPDQDGPTAEMRDMLRRQQRELAELRKLLSNQEQEIRKLRDMVMKKAE